MTPCHLCRLDCAPEYFWTLVDNKKRDLCARCAHAAFRYYLQAREDADRRENMTCNNKNCERCYSHNDDEGDADNHD